MTCNCRTHQRLRNVKHATLKRYRVIGRIGGDCVVEVKPLFKLSNYTISMQFILSVLILVFATAIGFQVDKYAPESFIAFFLGLLSMALATIGVIVLANSLSKMFNSKNHG